MATTSKTAKMLPPNAGLWQHGKRYRDLLVTVLGDDLYCRQPLCERLLAEQFNFILSCLPKVT